MVAISRSRVKIYIAAAGTHPTSVVSTTNLIAGQIKSYSRSGGEVEVESDAVFGGYVAMEKPISDVDIEMEVIPDLTTSVANTWDAMMYSKDSHNSTMGIYTMSKSGTGTTVPTQKCIIVYATDGTNKKIWAYNNATVTKFDLSHNADENQTGTIGFKFAPETSTGLSNFQTAATDANGLVAWSGLDAA